ncbi:MAG: hypothetical protein V7K50_06930 [Nostoc sp.]|uniref:hypothetical protein n=1 Tax=Nostoc sp. TaxID=1180 RepID=UPI002FFB8A24
MNIIARMDITTFIRVCQIGENILRCVVFYRMSVVCVGDRTKCLVRSLSPF